MSEPMYEINLDRVANQPISEGLHPFQVRNIEEGESSNNNPMWTVRLVALEPDPEAGKEVTMWLVLTDSMRWKLEKFLDAVGAPPQGSSTYKNFIGRKLRAQISHRVNDGRTLADVGEMFSYTNPNAAAKSPVAKAGATPVVKAAAKSTTVVKGGGPAKAVVSGGKGLPADTTEEDLKY